MEAQGIQIARAFVSVEPDLRKLEAGFAAGDAQAKAFANKVAGSFGKVESAAAADAAKVSNSWTQAGKSMQAAGVKMQTAGTAMVAGGKRTTKALTVPILGLGAVSSKMAIDFEKSMRNVNSIAQLPERRFQRLNKQVLAMAGPTAQAPKTLAEGLYDLVSSGFDASESIKILNSSARAATAGLTTTEVSTKAVAAALNAYRRPAEEAGAISDDLFQTVNLGVVSFDELASTIGYVLPAAATMSVNLKEVGASISTLTKEGQSGSNAVTNINAALTSFIKPSKAMKGVLDELGYETSVGLVKQKGFQGAVEAVSDAVDGNKESIGKLFPNVRSMRAVFGLTGQNVKSAGEDLRGFQSDAGATSKVLEQQSKSLSYQWNQLKAEASVLAIEVGNKLIPVLRDLAGDVTPIIQAFTDLPPGLQNTALKFLLVAAAMGPVLVITGKMVGAFGTLWEAGGKAVAMLGGLAGAEAVTAGATTAASAETVGANVAAAESYAALGLAAEVSAGAQVAAAAEVSAAQMTMNIPEAAGAAGQMSLLATPVKAAPAAAVGGEAAAGAGMATAGAAAAAAAPEILLAAAAIAVVTGGLVLLYKMSSRFRDEVGELGDTAKRALGEVVDQFDPLVHSFSHLGHAIENMHGPVGAIANIFKGEFLDAIGIAMNQAKQFISGLGNFLSGEIQIIRGLIDLVANVLEGRWGKAWESVKTIFRGGVKAVVGLVKMVTAPIRGSIEFTGSMMVKAFTLVWSGVEAVFSDGADAIVGIVNTIIDVLNKIPGVDIGHVGGGSDSPGKTKMTKQEKTRGYFSGGQITQPRAIVGEQAPAHNEWVIATNPAYRDQNVEYWRRAGHDLGVPGFATGGLMGVGGGGTQLLGLSIPNPVDVAGEAAGAVGGAVGGAAKSVAGDLIGAGAEKFIGMLPKPNLPDPFAAVGPYLIDTVTDWIKDGFKSKKIGDVDVGGIGGFTGAPANMKQLGDNAYVDSHTLAVTAALDGMFGLSMSSGYRSPAHNAAVNGAPNSYHTHGTPSNPGATDSVGSMGAMNAYIAFAKSHVAGLQEAMVDNVGNGWNAHLGFFGQGGLLAGGKKGAGGFGLGKAGGGFGKATKLLSGSDVPDWVHGSSTLSADQLATLAHGVGAPNPGLMSQIAQAESGGDPRAMGGAGDKGLWQIIPSTASAFGIDYGGLFDPWNNAAGMKKIVEGQGLGAWSTYNSGAYSSETKGKVSSSLADAGTKKKEEVVPGMFHGAHTHALSFGGIPKSLPGIEKEIRRWEKEIKTYRHAAKKAEGKPKTQQAIEANVTKIEGRLKELRHARAQQRREAAKKKFTKRLTGKLGKLVGVETDIEGAERSYETASQYAEQLVALEPTMPELPDTATDGEREAAEKTYAATLQSYVDNQERPAYGKVLTRENEWRNIILGGQSKATVMETGWEGRIRNLEENIASINAFSDKVAGDVASYRKAHPDAKGLPDKLQREQKKREELLAKVPMMRFKEAELRKVLGEGRDVFYGGADHPVHPPLPPLAGTGSFEDSLKGVQGVHWPDQHAKLGALPAVPIAGQFGGAIWDTQMSISELGLKTAGLGSSGAGAGAGEGDQALVEAARKIITENSQRELVGAVQKPILDAFAAMPPFGGSFLTGGEVPGPTGAARTVIAHGGETITPVGGSSSAPVVYVIIEDGAVDPSKIRVVAAEEYESRSSKGGRTAGRRLPGTAGMFSPGS